jgi:exopolysaccharide/PEP-CTERM locus tyrosine autokinase
VQQAPVYRQPVRPEPFQAPVVPEVPVQRVAPPVVAVRVQPLPEPALPAHRVTIDRARLVERGMLVPDAPIGVLAEEFRLVKRQLLLTARAVEAAGRGELDRSRMILVCSAQPDEGKTFCAINLALSMAAEQDVEILLVDADFAKPDVLKRLGVPEGPGLLDVLAGSVASVEDCIVATDVPHLSLLPAGSKSARDTELIASDRARAVIEGLASAHARRIVIFDSPPVLAASPASVLALHVGQVMLVVRADRTSESDLREAVGLLEGCEHIQLVLNSVSFQPGGRRFGSYYGEGK